MSITRSCFSRAKAITLSCLLAAVFSAGCGTTVLSAMIEDARSTCYSLGYVDTQIDIIFIAAEASKADDIAETEALQGVVLGCQTSNCLGDSACVQACIGCFSAIIHAVYAG